MSWFPMGKGSEIVKNWWRWGIENGDVDMTVIDCWQQQLDQISDFPPLLTKDLLEMKRTKVYSKNLLMKTILFFLPVFYLIKCLMKALKNFGKIAIFKIWELVSLVGAKTHFGKIALKWCISGMKKNAFD